MDLFYSSLSYQRWTALGWWVAHGAVVGLAMVNLMSVVVVGVLCLVAFRTGPVTLTQGWCHPLWAWDVVGLHEGHARQHCFAAEQPSLAKQTTCQSRERRPEDSSQRQEVRGRTGSWVMGGTVKCSGIMMAILEMKRLPLTHFIWSRTELLEWCVIAVVWMRVCLGKQRGLHSGLGGNRWDHTHPNHQGPKPESRGMTT